MNNPLVINQLFKKYLIDHKEQYNCWDVIHDHITAELVNVYKWNLIDTPTKERLRLRYFKEIQRDTEWVRSNGVPISKNRVGIKLTNNDSDINEYIKSETKRALSIFKKLTPIKQSRTMIRKDFFEFEEEMENIHNESNRD